MRESFEASDIAANKTDRLRRFCRAIIADKRIAARTLHRSLNLVREHDFSNTQSNQHDIIVFRKFFQAMSEIVGEFNQDRLAHVAYLLINLEDLSIYDAASILHLTEYEVVDIIQRANSLFHSAPRKKILIIEDELLIAFGIYDHLRRLNYEIVGVTDSVHEAINLAKRHKPHLLISDIALSDGSGISAVEEINKILGPIPVVFETGFGGHALEANLPNSFVILRKPYKLEALSACINLVLYINVIVSI
ncbi:MAG: hypothetical protein CVT77_05370 [Alphaproteobacteria bacterium HGW-Alphaproteobacteria-16]|nr:MAG: hypothetical protein CVT77_05370 [Alphaproteobacteria bacterium HGW-Alphaproteobacteria-16]